MTTERLSWAVVVLFFSAIGLWLFIMSCQAHLPNRLIHCHLMAREVAADKLIKDERQSDRNVILSSWRLRAHYRMIGTPAGTRLSQPWDSPDNREFAHRIERAEFGTGFSNIPMYAIRGQGSAFDHAIDKVPHEVLPRDAILLVEICNSGCHWMEPGDVYLDNVHRTGIKVIPWPNSKPCYDGFCVGFADGAAWSLKAETPPELVLQMATLEFAQNHKREEIFGPYVIEKRGSLTNVRQ